MTSPTGPATLTCRYWLPTARGRIVISDLVVPVVGAGVGGGGAAVTGVSVVAGCGVAAGGAATGLGSAGVVVGVGAGLGEAVTDGVAGARELTAAASGPLPHEARKSPAAATLPSRRPFTRQI